MIRVFANISGTAYDALLPTPPGWGVNAERPRAARQTLAGNVIHQVAMKDISTAEVNYSNHVLYSESSKIESIDALGTSCFLCDGYHLYEAIIDAKITNSSMPGKKLLNIKFNVIRKIL